MIAVLGAGAMGVALATHLIRAGNDTVVLATDHDEPVVRAWQRGEPHPALGVTLPPGLAIVEPDDWRAALAVADIVLVAVSSQGLHRMLEAAGPHVSPGTIWALATKGWQPESLRTPTEVAAAVLGPAAPVVSIAGPGMAAEIVAGSPTALLCASRDHDARRPVAQALTTPSMLVVTTSDVAGAETASAFKNVAAIAVGIAEGMSERFIESAFVRTFANARAAMFAQGMIDMVRLAEVRGGHPSTVMGLAGSGDLYVTCVGGRNGRFGRLLGAGSTPEQAVRAIGSTVEGVPNTVAALSLAARYSIELPTAHMVDLALRRHLTDDDAMDLILDMFSGTVKTGSSGGR
jgi:glycerol-3-phosphate dehydrogenase (NAD(P)+)